MIEKAVRFNVEEANAAAEEWGFNCGPGALCAVLNLRPDELRPLMGDFEKKRYTNPTLMLDVLNRAGVTHRRTYRSDEHNSFPLVKGIGLVRVQWGGPWTKPGVPMMARYRQTHWVAMRDSNREVFDVNAMCVGGWISDEEWSNKLVPWLCREVVPKWDGTFWPTHVLELDPIGKGGTEG